MQKQVKKWLRSLILNFLGLVLALGAVYVAGVATILQVSTRATARNPYFKVNGLDFLAIIIGIVAIWFVFRCLGKIYTLLTENIRPD